MRILVVIFSLLGMLGTGFFGFVMQTAVSEADKQDGKSLVGNIDRELKAIEDGTLPVPDKAAAIKGFTDGKNTIQRALMLPIVLFGSLGLGFVMMILSVFKLGPKPVSGVGLLAAGGVPLGFTFSIINSMKGLFEFQKTLDPTTTMPFTPEQLQNANLFILGCCGGFLLAGLCAFFVKRD
jgi:hypothetical protein